MRLNRQATWMAVAGLALLVVASCGYGTTTSAIWVTDVGARLTGTVHSTEIGTTEHHFEYGATTAYGATTPIAAVTIADPDTGVPVTADIAGLAEGTEYHYRLCAFDVGTGHGSCSADATITTSTGQDSVTGSGWLYLSPVAKIWIGSEAIDARSAPDGSGASGRASADPGPSSPFFRHHGTVTCLRVSGNRAAIGFVTDSSTVGTPMMVFVEDNGPSGDRWGRVLLDDPATTCPEPVEADFPPFLYAGVVEFPSTLTVGDFTVHDHPIP